MSLVQQDIREMLASAALLVSVGSRYRRYDGMEIFVVLGLQYNQMLMCVVVTAKPTTSNKEIEVPIQEWTSLIESGYGSCPKYILL